MVSAGLFGVPFAYGLLDCLARGKDAATYLVDSGFAGDCGISCFATLLVLVNARGGRLGIALKAK